MTQTERLTRARLIVGTLSAILGTIGFVAEVWWITAAGLACVVMWIGITMRQADEINRRLVREALNKEEK